MDDTAEGLRFHQQTVDNESNSPLHLIREKELEISGRMLAAKRRADEIVAEARSKAAATVDSAQDEAKQLALSRDKVVTAELEQQVAAIHSDAERRVEEIERTIADRTDAAVSYVVTTVLGS